MPINPINPLIPLQSQAPDIGATFSNALLNIGKLDQIRQGRQEAPTRQRLLESQAGTAEQAAGEQVKSDRFKSVVMGAVDINRQPDDQSKLQAAYRRRDGLIEQQKTNPNVSTVDTDEYIALAEAGDFVGAQTLLDNTIQAGQRSGIIKADVVRGGLASAKTEILESGASIQALPNREVEVRNPLGQIVEGQERLDVLQEAKDQESAKRQEQADTTVSTAKRVSQVQKATKTADKAFGVVEKIRQNITNLKEVAPLLGEGATSGPISQLFPSIKASTIKLENLQKRLALDVIGTVTFGALSKGELDLARAVAIPLGLEGEPLKKWVNDSIAAKEKLADYFEEQAIFLGQGNTQADWLSMKKAELKDSIGDATDSDIRATMKENNMTRPQVIQELKRRRLSGGA